MFTHTLIGIWQGQNGETIRGSAECQAGGEVNIDEAIPENSADLEVALALDVSQIKSLFIVSDKAATIKTNSSSVPDNTIALAANVPFAWNHQTGQQLSDTTPEAIATDIVKIFVTCAEGCALKIRILVDPTA